MAEIEPVGYYEGELGGKFGTPRQGGIAPSLRGRVIFSKKYASPSSVRGLDGFERVWLIWGFSENRDVAPGLTVRPPRLGGNAAVGVFASRSPYRPNALGLSAVTLLEVAPDGSSITVGGADLIDGTPVYDVKPYVAYADAFPDSRSGIASEAPERLEVVFPEDFPFKGRKLEALREILSLDPRPAYQDDPERIYGLVFDKKNVRFLVRNGRVEVL